MPKFITILAITVNTTPVRYISTTVNRADKSIVAETTADINQAHDFVTMDNAERIIPRIFNPYQRVYRPEKIEVSKRRYQEVREELN